MNLTIAEILDATGGKLIRGTAETTITQVGTDSRTVERGTLFVALVGEKFDGHDFLDEVCQKGGMGAVISKQTAAVEANLPVIIKVEDTLIALGDIANCHRQNFDLPIVAITGSNGKTTTKNMAASVLSQQCSVFQSEKSYNNQIGIPSRLLQLTEAADVAVLEIGTSWPGEIERLSKITMPTVGVITNIGASHLELLGSVEGVAMEKGALLDHVEYAILNADDAMTPGLAQRACGQIIQFSAQTESDVFACDIEADAFGRLAFTLRINEQVERVHLPCIGEHNISNALAAACVGLWAGLPITEIRTGLEQYTLPAMRMQPIEHDGLFIINDAYNSNPNSLKSALECLGNLEPDGKRIAILGDMLELGVHSRTLHRQAAADIPANIRLLITVGPHSLEIARGAEGRMESIVSCESPKTAAQKLRQYAQPGDAVLIKGSRGMKLEEILEDL